jgi:hypothetical protein
MLVFSMFENLREIFEQYRSGDIDHATWRSNGAVFGWVVAQPGGEWAWKRYAEVYPEFRRATESLPGKPPAA